MDTFYDRTALLIGEDALNKIKAAKVLIVGMGGVGGYIAEALARAGVGNLDFCDYDVVDTTNINRQIFALTDTVGKLKVNLAKDRINKINPNAQVVVYPFRLDAGTLHDINLQQYDYIADAVDDVKAKILLIKAALECGTPVISSMGTGNKLDPFKFKIDVIEKTHTCPLAKAVRRELHALGIKGIPVLYSEELPQTQQSEERRSVPASISYMPAIAGLMMASKILKDLIELN
ncbi:MAG: tRNA threonylcarbamoyladenosine dehydratase [Clostridia bacterium]|nr:tRNA threonylcarbamoyladenosine dehydratase [Clostridia bacterium]